MRLKRIVERLGMRSSPAACRDFRRHDDVIEAIYLARGQPFLFDMPLPSCRGWLGLPFAEGHPYVDAVRHYLETGDQNSETSPLNRYYGAFQPKSVAEAYGINDPDTPLAALPPVAAMYPWSADDPSVTAARRIRVTEIENRNRGGDVEPDGGFSRFGPISSARAAQECKTLFALADSIRTEGYQRDKAPDDINIVLLFDRDETPVGLVTAGHHRAAVLAALAHTTLPVRVSSKLHVRAAHAAHWPLVKTGLLDAATAEKIFDLIHSGVPAVQRPSEK
jgi:hypothetical protein